MAEMHYILDGFTLASSSVTLNRCLQGNIRIAIKVGGSADPTENTALSAAIDAALKESVPKAGIEKALVRC